MGERLGPSTVRTNGGTRDRRDAEVEHVRLAEEERDKENIHVPKGQDVDLVVWKETASQPAQSANSYPHMVPDEPRHHPTDVENQTGEMTDTQRNSALEMGKETVHESGRPNVVQVNNWTEEEDEMLSRLQKQIGNRWSIIARHIPGRTGQQCAQRWRHKVNPEINRDKWTLEEDKALLAMYNQYPGKWAQIASALPGRTDQQCMGRYLRHLDPNIKRDLWCTEEDKKLISLKQEHGTKWSVIARNIQGRTPQQCRARWFTLSGSKSSKSDDNSLTTKENDTAANIKKAPTSNERASKRWNERKKQKSDSDAEERQSSDSAFYLPQQMKTLQMNSLQSSPTSSTSAYIQEIIPFITEECFSPTFQMHYGNTATPMQTYNHPLSPVQALEPIKLTAQNLTSLDYSTPCFSSSFLEGSTACPSQPIGTPKQVSQQCSPAILETLFGHPHVDVDSPEWASLRAILGGVGAETSMPPDRLDQWKTPFQQPLSPLGLLYQRSKESSQPHVMLSQDMLSPPQLVNNGISFQGGVADCLNLFGS